MHDASDIEVFSSLVLDVSMEQQLVRHWSLRFERQGYMHHDGVLRTWMRASTRLMLATTQVDQGLQAAAEEGQVFNEPHRCLSRCNT